MEVHLGLEKQLMHSSKTKRMHTSTTSLINHEDSMHEIIYIWGHTIIHHFLQCEKLSYLTLPIISFFSLQENDKTEGKVYIQAI